MKQWKCIQCGNVFSTPTDAEPFPMTCDACRASHKPDLSAYLRPNAIATRAAGISGLTPTPQVYRPAAATSAKVHTASVADMMKRPRSHTNLPTVRPGTPPTGAAAEPGLRPTPPGGGRRRSTSIVGGTAHDHHHATEPTRSARLRKTKTVNRTFIALFVAATILVGAVAVMVLLNMGRPAKPKPAADTATSTADHTPPTTPVPTATPPAPAAPAAPIQPTAPDNPAQPLPARTPAPPPTSPMPTTPVVAPALPVAPPPQAPTQPGKVLFRCECAANDEAGGHWRRVTCDHEGDTSLWTWTAPAANARYPFFFWDPRQDFTTAVYFRVRYRVTGSTKDHLAIVLYCSAAQRLEVDLPTPPDKAGVWQVSQQFMATPPGKMQQVEIRTPNDADPGMTISFDWMEIDAAEPATSPAPAIHPAQPLPPATPPNSPNSPAPAPPATDASGAPVLLHLNADAKDQVNSAKWYHGQLLNQNGLTFARWTLTGTKKGPGLQFENQTQDMLAIGNKVQLKIRLRQKGMSGNLGVKLYVHNDHASEAQYGRGAAALPPDGQWGDVVLTITGQGGPLRDIEFLVPDDGLAPDAALDIDTVDVVTPP